MLVTLARLNSARVTSKKRINVKIIDLNRNEHFKSKILMPPLNTFKQSCLALAITQTIALPLQAATITVDSISDTPAANICSLRSAIIAANTNAPVDGCVAGDVSGSDTIDLSGLPNNSTITLNGNELPTVTTTISLNGPGQDNLTISGNNSSRIISVRNGGDLTVSSMTLSNGSVSRGSGSGGAIRVIDGHLTINSSTLLNNYADNDGGGIYATSSTVNLSNSTVSGNSAGDDGGGIFARDESSVSLSNSTVS